jgi:hypothetical protein
VIYMTQPKKINGYTEVQRKAMCTSKHRYSDQLAAMAGGYHSLETHGTGYKKLYCYRCLICSGWHLTKQKNNQFDVIELEVRDAPILEAHVA